MWERENLGRVGLEAYFTGSQRLEDNPFRSQSLVRGYREISNAALKACAR